MFSKIVEEEVEQLATDLVQGQFYIGLEAVKKFVMFIIMTDYIQKKQKDQGMSIWKYAQNQLKLPEETNEMPPEKVDALIFNNYERILYLYNTITKEKRIEHLLRQKQEEQRREMKKEKNKQTQGNSERFQGLDLFPYQINEFSILYAIKEGKYDDVNASLTQKRIISEKGYLRKINFKSFKEYIKILESQIDESNDQYKNIQYYKLEKRLGFELIKAIYTQSTTTVS